MRRDRPPGGREHTAGRTTTRESKRSHHTPLRQVFDRSDARVRAGHPDGGPQYVPTVSTYCGRFRIISADARSDTEIVATGLPSSSVSSAGRRCGCVSTPVSRCSRTTGTAQIPENPMMTMTSQDAGGRVLGAFPAAPRGTGALLFLSVPAIGPPQKISQSTTRRSSIRSK